MLSHVTEKPKAKFFFKEKCKWQKSTTKAVTAKQKTEKTKQNKQQQQKKKTQNM